MKTQQGGFTLIELVVVIVILGILAAVATPRFSSQTLAARQAVVDGALGAFLSQAVISLADADGVAPACSVVSAALITSNLPVTFGGTGAGGITVTHDDDALATTTSGDISSLCTGAP